MISSGTLVATLPPRKLNLPQKGWRIKALFCRHRRSRRWWRCEDDQRHNNLSFSGHSSRGRWVSPNVDTIFHWLGWPNRHLLWSPSFIAITQHDRRSMENQQKPGLSIILSAVSFKHLRGYGSASGFYRPLFQLNPIRLFHLKEILQNRKGGRIFPWKP